METHLFFLKLQRQWLERLTKSRPSEKMDTMLYHIRLILQLADGKPPELAIREARKHAAWYISGLHGAAAFRARCYQLQSYAEAEQLAADVKEANPE